MLLRSSIVISLLVLLIGCGAAHTVRESHTSAPSDEAFQTMLQTLQTLGWTITASDRDAGLISAEKAERQKRKPELEVSVVITPKGSGADVRVSVSKAGRRSRRQVQKEAEAILKQYSSPR